MLAIRRRLPGRFLHVQHHAVRSKDNLSLIPRYHNAPAVSRPFFGLREMIFGKNLKKLRIFRAGMGSPQNFQKTQNIALWT